MKFISNRNEKTQITINKPVYLGLSILDRSESIIYEYWLDYISNYEIDRPLPMEKKRNRINERRIRGTNHERICWVKSENIEVFN